MRPQKTKAWWKQDWLWTVYVISPWVAYPFLVILCELFWVTGGFRLIGLIGSVATRKRLSLNQITSRCY